MVCKVWMDEETDYFVTSIQRQIQELLLTVNKFKPIVANKISVYALHIIQWKHLQVTTDFRSSVVANNFIGQR